MYGLQSGDLDKSVLIVSLWADPEPCRMENQTFSPFWVKQTGYPGLAMIDCKQAYPKWLPTVGEDLYSRLGLIESTGILL